MSLLNVFFLPLSSGVSVPIGSLATPVCCRINMDSSHSTRTHTFANRGGKLHTAAAANEEKVHSTRRRVAKVCNYGWIVGVQIRFRAVEINYISYLGEAS